MFFKYYYYFLVKQNIHDDCITLTATVQKFKIFFFCNDIEIQTKLRKLGSVN